MAKAHGCHRAFFLQFQTVLLVLDRSTDGQKYFIELFLFLNNVVKCVKKISFFQTLCLWEL